MSKRKSRKTNKPNLPESTLQRARAQARDEDYEPEDEAPPPETAAPVKGKASEGADDKPEAAASSAARSRRRSSRSSRGSRRSAAPVQFSQRRSSSDGVDKAAIQNTLANPTKFVTEEQLSEEYGYVVSDVRNMFILAVGLMVLLVVLAQFI